MTDFEEVRKIKAEIAIPSIGRWMIFVGKHLAYEFTIMPRLRPNGNKQNKNYAVEIAQYPITGWHRGFDNKVTIEIAQDMFVQLGGTEDEFILTACGLGWGDVIQCPGQKNLL